MEDMSTLMSQLGTTVCSDFSESIGECDGFDSFEKLFEGDASEGVKTVCDAVGQGDELYKKVTEVIKHGIKAKINTGFNLYEKF